MDIKTYMQMSEREYGIKITKGIYEYWNAINDFFYNSELPCAYITFELLPYGACVGLTNPNTGHIRIKKPQKGTPICLDSFTIGTLVHECIHYAFPYIGKKVIDNSPLLGTKSFQETSHNSIYWITEINRIHKIVSNESLGANITKIVRNGKTTKHVKEGNLSRSEISRYPYNKETEQLIFDYLNSKIA